MRRLLFVVLLLVPSALLGDGMIVIPRPVPNVPRAFPLSVTYHHVTVDIKDGVAKTSVDQEFFNPTSSRLEGEYIFPLPKGAVISNFAMEIDGKMTTAELLDAAKARRIYEDIVRSMRDPALLEYIGKGAFKVRIFPIEPRSRKKIRLSYSEVVRQDGGLHAYTYPLNTEKFSDQPLEEVAIRVNLESSQGLKTIFCPTHEVEVRRKGNRSAVIGFEEKRTRPDEDFILYYSTDDKQIGVSVLCHRPSGEDGYFLLTVTPAYDAGTRPQPKDVTFVFDTSGSMSGRKMDQAKRALRFGLGTLQIGDRFEVIRFSTEAEALFGELRPASRENVATAQKFIDGLEPIGGTNSEEALKLAIETNRGPSSRPKIVVFMTDGKPTIGETDEERLVKRVTDANLEKMRVFTFGLGDDLNTHFLDKLTERTRAARTYVSEKEDLELPMSTFFEKIKSPVLVEPSIEFGAGMRAHATYPRNLPDLFKGSPLVVFGRYTGAGTAITLHGTVDGKRVSIPYYVQFPSHTEENEVIAPLWAAQRIGYLLDEIRLHGEEKELVDEATKLARRFGIITPYTSYLVLEDERRNVVREHQVFSAAPMPAARMRGEYDAMQSKAGAESVQASREVEALKNATNAAQTKQGAKRLDFKDAAGRTQNLAEQQKNVQGRAVYNVNGAWVDSKLHTAKSDNVQRVKFGSPEYWALLDKEPDAREFLALGRNVRFALRAQVIEVHE